MKKLPSRFTRPNRRRAGPVSSAEVFNPLRMRVDPAAVWLFVLRCIAQSLLGMLGIQKSTRHGKSPGKGSGKSPDKGSGKRPGKRPGKGSGKGSGKRPGKRPGKGSGKRRKRPGKAGKHSPVAATRPSQQRAVWLCVLLCIAQSLLGMLGIQKSTRHGTRPDMGSGKRPDMGSGKRPGKGSGKGSGKRPGKGSGKRPGKRRKRPGKAGKHSPVATARQSSAPVQVFVRTDWGERCLLLFLTQKCADAKAAILRECAPLAPSGELACLASAVWLSCGGKSLEGNETLAHAGVRAGSRLLLNVRVRGGGLTSAQQTSVTQTSENQAAHEQAAFMFASMDKECKGKLELHDIILYLEEHYQHLFMHQGDSQKKWHVDEEKLESFVSLLRDLVAEDGLVSRAAYVKTYCTWSQRTRATFTAAPQVSSPEGGIKAEEEEKAEEKAAAMTVEEAKPAEANLAEQKPAEEDKPDSEPRDGAQFASVAERHAKLALDPNGLVRVGKFGDIALFDSRLEEHVGFMDAKPLRGLYGEHVISVDSTTVFSPPNNPGLSCTPMGELAFVVGENGIDTETWELKADARPAQHGPHMVQGRNAKSIAELVESQEAKDAGLHDAEIVALRLYTGEIS